MQPSPFPCKFGRYTLVSRLAQGGMATLYLATADGGESSADRGPIVVKRIHSHLADDPRFVRMFKDEARLAAQIRHPNVVRIFEHGESEGECFYAMELLDGQSLAQIMSLLQDREEPVPLGFMAYVVARAAEGIHAAHELRTEDGTPQGIVHRDVTPQNILVTWSGQVKVVDFGIAKANFRLSDTLTGQIKGKYAYMSPEQLCGGPVDRRADIFSLGVVLYEATLLRRLFAAESEIATIDRILRCPILRPSKLDPSYPAELERIVMCALEKNPRKRCGTAAALADDSDRFVANALEARDSPGVMTWLWQHLRSTADLHGARPGAAPFVRPVGGTTDVATPVTWVEGIEPLYDDETNTPIATGITLQEEPQALCQAGWIDPWSEGDDSGDMPPAPPSEARSPMGATPVASVADDDDAETPLIHLPRSIDLIADFALPGDDEEAPTPVLDPASGGVPALGGPPPLESVALEWSPAAQAAGPDATLRDEAPPIFLEPPEAAPKPRSWPWRLAIGLALTGVVFCTAMAALTALRACAS